MSFFGFGSGPAKEKSYTAPDRSERARCWEARDIFFACLNKNEIVDAIKKDAEAQSKCGKELVGFDQNCAASWVEYFKKQRVMQDKKDRLMKNMETEGAVKM